MKTTLPLFFLIALGLFNCGASSTSAECTQTCQGCCTADGTCQLGLSNSECGNGGEACFACTANTKCSSGRCLSVPGDGAGGSTPSTGGTPSLGGNASAGGTLSSRGGNAAKGGSSSMGGAVSTSSLSVLSSWRGRYLSTSHQITSSDRSYVVVSIKLTNQSQTPLTLTSSTFSLGTDTGFEYDEAGTVSTSTPCTLASKVSPGASVSCTLSFLINNSENPKTLYAAHDSGRLSAAVPQVSCTNCGTSAPCVDLKTDPQYCGSCTMPNPSQVQSCVAGVVSCRVAGGYTQCPQANACFNLNSDINNCGACGKAYDATAFFCRDGQPRCLNSSQVLCGNACIDVKNDVNNCGMCGRKCPVDATCANNQCVATKSSTSFISCNTVCSATPGSQCWGAAVHIYKWVNAVCNEHRVTTTCAISPKSSVTVACGALSTANFARSECICTVP